MNIHLLKSSLRRVKILRNIYNLKSSLKRVKILRNVYNRTNNVYQESKNISWQRSKIKYFILLTNGRSGSTCLLDLFDSHPQIATNPHTFFNYTNLPTNFSQKKYTYSRKNILGFKFKAQPDDLIKDEHNIYKARQELQQLVDQEVSIIYLQRKNILKRALSKLVAQNELKKLNYNFNFTKEEHKCLEIHSFKIDIDLQELQEIIKECEEQEQFNQQVINQVPCLKLIYEEDLLRESNHQNTLDKICDFLNLEYSPAKTKYAKIAPDKMQNYISNYDELQQEFQHTHYQQYLD
jgi:LPS sulfotransferase NodH